MGKIPVSGRPWHRFQGHGNLFLEVRYHRKPRRIGDDYKVLTVAYTLSRRYTDSMLSC